MTDELRDTNKDYNSKMTTVLDNLNSFLHFKNTKYGNSMFEPLGIFTKHIDTVTEEPAKLILVRCDDKLKRIKNASQLNKNDAVDLMGYLVGLCVTKEWLDFQEFQD